MKLYSVSAVDRLIERYTENGGDVVQVKDGVLGHGTLILTGNGLKTTIIKEVYLNDSSSGHTARTYNEMPSKYKELV